MTKDYFDEPLPPGVKNLDNYEIDFPEHNLKDYVMYSPKSVKRLISRPDSSDLPDASGIPGSSKERQKPNRQK